MLLRAKRSSSRTRCSIADTSSGVSRSGSGGSRCRLVGASRLRAAAAPLRPPPLASEDDSSTAGLAVTPSQVTSITPPTSPTYAIRCAVGLHATPMHGVGAATQPPRCDGATAISDPADISAGAPRSLPQTIQHPSGEAAALALALPSLRPTNRRDGFSLVGSRRSACDCRPTTKTRRLNGTTTIALIGDPSNA